MPADAGTVSLIGHTPLQSRESLVNEYRCLERPERRTGHMRCMLRPEAVSGYVSVCACRDDGTVGM